MNKFLLFNCFSPTIKISTKNFSSKFFFYSLLMRHECKYIKFFKQHINLTTQSKEKKFTKNLKILKFSIKWKNAVSFNLYSSKLASKFWKRFGHLLATNIKKLKFIHLVLCIKFLSINLCWQKISLFKQKNRKLDSWLPSIFPWDFNKNKK